MKKQISLVAAVFAFIALTSAASAQQSIEAEAKAQFDAGVELYQQGKYEQASVAFARAYELRPSYKILYLVGQCEDKLGHYALSLDAYTRYLAEGGDQIDAARQAEVRKEIARLNAMVGTVAVETDASGAVVFVDDHRAGTTPLASPLFVDLGEHTVVVKKGTTELHREVVKVAGGQQVVVKVEGGATAGEGAESGPEGAPAPTDKPKRIWTWVALGIGGAAAVGAAITGGVSAAKVKDIKGQCEGNDCPPKLEDDADSAKTLGNAATALVVVAAVGVAAGVTLFFVEPKLGEDERAVEVAPVAAPTDGGAAFALVGRF